MQLLYTGFIAYTSDRSGAYDIWLYNPRSGSSVQLTNGLGDRFTVPVWSPDSSRIAFVGKGRIVFVIHAASGSVARIDQFEEGDLFRLAWSPDSRRLAYVKQDNIILYDVTAHQSQSIRQPGASDPQWFPDGDELLYQAPDESGISQLYRIGTDGSGKRQITRNVNGPLHNIRLSPDGAFALYTTPGVSISIIHTVEIATGNDYEVRGGPLAKNYFPEWSPDSSSIAYSATAFENGKGYFSLIRTAGRRGENDRTLTLSNCFATPVTWSPSGRKLAYLSGCSIQDIAGEMWVIDIDHPVPVKLIEGVRITALQWSPSPIKDFPAKTYTNPTYKVSFQYPAHWRKVNDERYEGVDGFFQISAIMGGPDIDEVCRGEAFHILMPYGSNPRILKSQIHQQEACFIIPSADQPAEMKRQAALIVRYPRPVLIQGEAYNYFILWADLEHIRDIASTLVFLP